MKTNKFWNLHQTQHTSGPILLATFQRFQESETFGNYNKQRIIASPVKFFQQCVKKYNKTSGLGRPKLSILYCQHVSLVKNSSEYNKKQHN